MSNKNDTEINSIVIPALAAGIFCVAVVLIRAFGPAAEPEELPESKETPVLRSWRADDVHENFARAVLAGLDLDGDGFDDVVIGAPGGPEGGQVRAFSGRSRAALWEPVTAPEGLGGFGSSLAFQPDVDGDEVAEILVGAPREGAGAVVMLSGRTGRPILRAPGLSRGERFGASVVALDDVDGDGVHDFAAGAPGSDRRNVIGAVRIVSGADGTIINNLSSSPRLGDRFGFSLTAIRDIDGDGSAELVVGAIGEGRNGYRAGAVRVYSPRTGVLLHRLDGDEANAQFGHDLDSCGDRDGDGIDDFLASACNPTGRGYVLLVSGKTGRPLARYEEGAHNDFGHSVAACGDMNGDGRPDLAVGAPLESHQDLGDVGAVYVFSGRGGELLGRLSGNREGGMFGRDIDGLRDVNDDGIPEIVVGARHRCIATYLLQP